MIRFTYPDPLTKDTAENRLAHTFYLVEANTHETYELWVRYSGDSLYPQWDARLDCRAYPEFKWEQESMGWSVQVGTLAGRPVMMSVQWYRIEGRWVCFYYGCSQVVDHRMIEAWLEQHFTGGAGKRAMCDAANFNHCLQAIKEANAAAIEGKAP